MRILIILLFQLSVIFTSAQNITGIWRGAFSGGQTSVFERLHNPQATNPYKYEVQIKDVSGQLKGVTYSYQDTSFYGKASFSGTFDPKSNRVLVQEKKMLELRIASNSSACIMTCYLEYSKLGREEFLEGPFTSLNVRDSSDCGRGRVRLRKVPFSDFKKEPFLSQPKTDPNGAPDPRDRVKTSAPTVKKTAPVTPKKTTTPTKPNTPPTVKKQTDSVKKANPVVIGTVRPNDIKPAIAAPKITPKVIAGRENVLVSTIEVTSNEVTVKLYDNGVIDKDTISVFRNNQLILSKQQLTAKPLTLSFRIEDADDVQELVMVAENLGEVPPNTALMVVECGDLKKEVRITSNLQKNAMIRFKLKK
ncbi:MAG: hypothetical protein ACO1NW_08470 [Chitinophagaceae bacterium]